VNSWSRWVDIQKHGHFKHKLEIDDIRTIARAMVSSEFLDHLSVFITCMPATLAKRVLFLAVSIDMSIRLCLSSHKN